MTITINGTTGLAGVDGSAGTPAVQGADTNTGVFFPAADTVAIATGGTERVRTDSSGNVGIGVTPSAWGTNTKAFQISSVTSLSGTSNALQLSCNRFNNTSGDNVYLTTAAASLYQQFGGGHQWYTAPSGTAGNAITFTQAMTLDASGNLLVGTTSLLTGSPRLNVSSTGSYTATLVQADNADRVSVRIQNGYATGAQSATMIQFVDAGGTERGTVKTTGTATSYNTSSDYRLKEDIQPMQGALAKVAALKPVTYKWKVDGSNGEGFIAHELAEVVPQCVTGKKDAVDAEGNPVYQGIDTSFLVATLTAALQEAHGLIKDQAAAIESLTARITALEGAAS